MKILKNKKLLLLITLFFLFIIFILGFISLISGSKTQSKKTNYKKDVNFYKSELNRYPEFKDLLQVLEGKDLYLEKAALDYLKAEMISTGGKRIELEAKLIKKIDNYVKNIKINNLKDERVYAEELKKEIENLKYVNLDFNDKNNLRANGQYILSVASNISKIEVPKSYYEFHKLEVIILGMLGEALVELSNTEDSEKGTSLLLILNDLANLQEKILEKL